MADNSDYDGLLGCAWAVIAFILAVFLFGGEPDIHGVLLAWLMKQ